MRRNRIVSKKMSVMATTSMRFGAIIVVFFVMVILNMLSSSSCTQLLKIKGEKEREIVKLDDSLMRESTRWEEMVVEEKIEQALRSNGLEMRPPKPERQVIRMMKNGTPRPGQMSVAAAKRRNELLSAALEAAPGPAKTLRGYSRRKVRQ